MGNTDTFCFSSDPFSSSPLGQMKHEVQISSANFLLYCTLFLISVQTQNDKIPLTFSVN